MIKTKVAFFGRLFFFS